MYFYGIMDAQIFFKIVIIECLTFKVKNTAIDVYKILNFKVRLNKNKHTAKKTFEMNLLKKTGIDTNKSNKFIQKC